MTTNTCVECGLVFKADRKSRKCCSATCLAKHKSAFFTVFNPAARPIEERFFEKVKIGGENVCWIWAGAVNKNGYGSILHRGKIRTASRVAYEIQVGQIESGKHVLHHCDTPLCVNPRHLYLGDNKQNTNDRVTRGRVGGIGINGATAGEKNIKAKLTENNVAIIRSTNISSTVIAKQFGVDPNTILSIRARKTWRHI